MTIYEIIAKKRDGGELTPAEIRFFIDGYVKGTVADYQAAAWCMAVFCRGMTAGETAALTEAMVASGETLDLQGIAGTTVDKHSTGGVGDTTTLIVAPLVAAMGIPVAKLSGRGLGHTGGTLDKLESIAGFDVQMDQARFVAQVQAIGLAVAGQTAQLVPADRLLYALRDVTATVESVPLIAASIMSKKLAAGCQAIMLDVKVGHGAFMKSQAEAEELARAMVAIGEKLGRRTMALLTKMDQPLGNAVGNALEVEEAVAILENRTLYGRGRVSPDLREVSLALAARMAWLAGKAETVAQGRMMAEEALRSGAALAKWAALVESQGGTWLGGERLAESLPQAQENCRIGAPVDGWIGAIDGLAIGRAAASLGAGRVKKGDPVDSAVGIVLHKRIGDPVGAGECVVELWHNGRGVTEAQALVKGAYQWATGPVAKPPLILGEIR
ncbi:thymidine phosphorylase [Heliophilum fasciatum]|uniref:Pyrimidine-nucleoside phosphorylase n=1 Tax=Heliophilum fasciatum TaxID=35700 RepID=A0A4R2RWQ3_9FIRM|nr:thymidine phosphorylase [Heliophilum fasciatum]MCW2277361.1 pyrimidine-nucleoside phosphorylase [Heliophilum fasciatum]TCP67197.1 thymidine phosphorylase [Heliophilum fasciatum]